LGRVGAIHRKTACHQHGRADFSGFNTQGGHHLYDLPAAGGRDAALTQIRLRSRPSSFGVKLDDNNNTIANYLSLFSGNAAAANRPQLVVEYYVP